MNPVNLFLHKKHILQYIHTNDALKRKIQDAFGQKTELKFS